MVAKTTVLADIREFFQHEAPVGATDVYPGMLVSLTSGAIVPHASAGAKPNPKYVALESVRPDGGGLTSAYTETSESVPYYIPLVGDRLNVLLATSQTIVAGDNLTSNGSGYWKKVGSGDTAVAIAREAVTTTSSAAFILAEILE